MIHVCDLERPVIRGLYEHYLPSEVVVLSDVYDYYQYLIVGAIEDNEGGGLLLHEVGSGELDELGLVGVELDGDGDVLDEGQLVGHGRLGEEELADVEALGAQEGKVEGGV